MSISHDPRYRKGVFVGFDPNERARKARELHEAIALAHPLSHGWTFAYWNDDLDQAVYQLGPAKMAYLSSREAWLVDLNGRQVLYQGSMDEISSDVKEATNEL